MSGGPLEQRPRHKRSRVLLVDNDAAALEVARTHLEAADFEVVATSDPLRAIPLALAQPPDLVLIERYMPVLHGAELIRGLRAFPATRQTSVAFLIADDAEATLIRCIRVGAVDVLHKPFTEAHVRRLAGLVDELDQPQLPSHHTPEAQVRTLLGVFRRSGREGQLVVNAGTPFEGRAVFRRGALVSAELGPAVGLVALEEMLSFEEGTWRFLAELPPLLDPGLSGAGKGRREDVTTAPGRAQRRVLFVDDDGDLRRMYAVHLHRAGFGVETAEDGLEAYQRALATEFDLAISDLNMPRLDGWGLLQKLRADHRTRDLPVIFISAHDDYRETLKAARAGAWDYLPKTGRAEVLIHRAQAAMAARSRIADLFESGKADLELGVLGPRWVLRLMGELGVTGRMEAKDDWSRYTLEVQAGMPIAATADGSAGPVEGIGAVCAFLVSRNAHARFEAAPVTANATFDQGMAELLAQACQTLNHLDEQVQEARLGSAAALEVDGALYELYRRIAADRDVLIAKAVCEERVALADLTTHLSLPAEAVEASLLDLLRRRVIRFASEA
jgi:DNA-binding response OmpR family regulator